MRTTRLAAAALELGRQSRGSIEPTAVGEATPASAARRGPRSCRTCCPFRRWRRRPGLSARRARPAGRRSGLAPALGLAAQPARNTPGSVRYTSSCAHSGGHELRHALQHGRIRARDSGFLLRQIRVEAPGHARTRVPVSPSTGSFAVMACAGVSWPRAAEGHEHRGRADGGVEALRPGPFCEQHVQAPHERRCSAPPGRLAAVPVRS